MRKTALYITTALLLVSSCNEALMEPQQTGSISLSLSSDREVVVDTKASSVDCSNFLVDIFGQTFLGQQYASDRYVYSKMTEPVVIPYGYYHVSAQSCLETAAEEGFGQVRYYGVSEQVDILSKATASVSVTCKMANGKATLTLDQSFMDDFADPYVELSVGSRTVSLSAEQSKGQTDVYFNVPEEGADLIYKVYGTIGKGTEQERQFTYSNSAAPMQLKPAKWAKITIKSNHNGLIGPDISVDGNMGDHIFTEILNPEGGFDSQYGEMPLTLQVDTRIDDATIIDCIIDVL